MNQRKSYSGGLDLLTLINDILDLSKVEAGKLNIQLEPFKLSNIIHNLKIQFNPLAKEKGLVFDLQKDEDVPEIILSDSQRTEQVLKNFLSNAFKFTSEGKVSLRIHLPPSEVQYSNKDLVTQKTMALMVSDTGIGIHMNKQKDIFEAFQQADGSTSRKFGGTGLGLTISRELAKLLGGEIQMQSLEGQGSTFTLFIPIVEYTKTSYIKEGSEKSKIKLLDAADAIIETGVEFKILKGRKILVVDDDLRNIFALSKVLQGAGMGVVMADDGKLALEKLESESDIEIIIMDMMMPIMDGYEAMQYIRENPLFSRIPIIALTGKAMSGDREKCILAGANEYITKPIDGDYLLTLIDAWLSKSQ